MSWFKENYEKVALGGAVVIAAGIGALIVGGGVGDKLEVKNPPQENTYVIPELEEIKKYKTEMSTPVEVKFQQHLDSDLNSFIPFPLYGVKGTDGLVELNSDTEFHGIPLSWWNKYGIEDYKFDGADQKDTDQDGFTNLEEYVKKTDPSDVSSHPDLIEKLVLSDSKKTSFKIQWSRLDAERASMNFTPRRGRTVVDYLAVGDTFPTKNQRKEYLNRFKVTGQGKMKNETTGIMDEFFEIQDLVKGQKVKLLRSDGARSFVDWTATLTLTTPNGGAFKVPEGGEFSLPFKEGGKGYLFKIKEKRNNKLSKLQNVDVEYNTKNGVKTKSITEALEEPVDTEPAKEPAKETEAETPSETSNKEESNP